MNKLFEKCDSIKHSGLNLDWRDDDAIPFAFNYENYVKDFWKGEIGKTHNFLNSREGIDRSFAGRVWFDNKIISFWETPKKEIFVDCIKKIEKLLNLKILNNNWQIEVRKRNYKGERGMFRYFLIPIEEYSESTTDTNAYVDHLDMKKNKKVIGKYGSPLALKQLMYAESVKYNEYNNNQIENVLNIKSNFMLCKRCGNQLHHGIRICNKCGHDNGINNGSTVRQMLYTAKHRSLKKDPLFITPEIIYDTYKGQLDGISKEEFLKYVNNNLNSNETKPVNKSLSLKYKKRKPLQFRQRLYQEKFVTLFEDFDPNKNKIHKIKIGNVYWYEYHCFESPKSCDADLWYRSHQQVIVINEEETEPGEPNVYKVKFDDGFIGSVFDDELMLSTEEFYRPDPPEKF